MRSARRNIGKPSTNPSSWPAAGRPDDRWRMETRVRWDRQSPQPRRCAGCWLRNLAKNEVSPPYIQISTPSNSTTDHSALGDCGQPRRASSAAHSHRDNRLATVVSGEWHFGYGKKADDAQTSVLTQGAFYTEPANTSHFA